MSISRNKVLVLKLGGQCNLHCKHCHCKRLDFKFNEDILEYIKNNNFTRITFSGGEPLLYLDIIKRVAGYIGKGMEYKIVSNGNLLDGEVVNFLNEYNVNYIISYDGEDNDSRDYLSDINWLDFADVKRKGFSVLYSESNSDIQKLMQDIGGKINMYGLNMSNVTRWINFVHQTDVNQNVEVNRELAVKYCTVLSRFLELEFMAFKRKPGKYPVMSHLFHDLLRKKEYRGVKCCNENVMPMTIEGKFLLCPYEEQYVGDIYTGIDWDKVESYIPDRCKGCSLWASCRNTCINNVTENECFISKVMYKHYCKLMDKYNVTYDELAKW